MAKSHVICDYFSNLIYKFDTNFSIRNVGPIPQKSEERLPTDPSRVVFKLVCPEWRINPTALPMPMTNGEPIDYEGPPWNPHDDMCLLKVRENWELIRKGGNEPTTTIINFDRQFQSMEQAQK
jgi:hypothetical protein